MTRRYLLLLLLLPFLFCRAPEARAQTEEPALLLISIDGFRTDYLSRGHAPVLEGLARRGVRAEAMRPSFPSLTFPNHYTLVTGLRPDRHGMVDNVMRDARRPGVTYSMSNRSETNDRFWWDDGEPIWVTAEKAGVRTATLFWPGSESDIHGVRPTSWLTFDKSLSPERRVERLLEWMGRPKEQQARFMTLYFDDVDTAGHQFGPDSREVNAAIEQVDSAIGQLIRGIEAMGRPVDLVIVSDHGMAATSPDRVIEIESLAPAGSFELVTQGAAVGLVPLAGREAEVLASVSAPHPHVACWPKARIPEHLHYGTHPRVPPVVCLPDAGWLLLSRETLARRPVRAGGAHGYDPAAPEMATLFLAAGPSFRQGVVLPAFDNVDLYPLLARLIGIKPLPSDGKAEVLSGALLPGARRPVGF
jgi:predicted AlkP superfamily pyrophosphatase or phosphodiesterase